MTEKATEIDAKGCKSDIYVSSTNIAGEYEDPVMRVVAACNGNGAPDCGWETIVEEWPGSPMDHDDWGLSGEEWHNLEAQHQAHSNPPAGSDFAPFAEDAAEWAEATMEAGVETWDGPANPPGKTSE